MQLIAPERESLASAASSDADGWLHLGDAGEFLAEVAEQHRGAVRLALLDPPYNTRAKFHHYGDSMHSDEWLAERRHHMELVRDALTDDGSVWIHLDDAEVHRFRVMMDEVFGHSNYVATVIWQKTRSRENRTAISEAHENIVVYAKDRAAWARMRNLLPYGPEQTARYNNPDNDPRGPWTSGDMTAKAGPGRRASQFFEIVTPSGRVVAPPPGMAWRYTKERYDELVADNRVSFGDGSRVPRLKRFLNETAGGLVPTTLWLGEEVGTTDTAKKHLRAMFPDIVPFETPKPEPLAERVLHIATNPDDLVIDCYGGSGTTAAVAMKRGRRWMTCEREERTFSEFLLPRLELVAAGDDVHGIAYDEQWITNTFVTSD